MSIQHVTKEIAVNANWRQVFYHKNARNTDGSALRVRVNGKCQTWKTRPEHFRLPVKYGIKGRFPYNEITHNNCEDYLISDPTGKGY